MMNWILLVFVFFTMVIAHGRSESDDSDPHVLELNSTFLNDDVHINNDDFISVSVNTTGSGEMPDPIEPNKSENETIVDNGDDKNFENDTENISNTNELVELKDTEINVKMDEVQSTVHAKMKETESKEIEISETEFDNAELFSSHNTDSKHTEIIFVEDGNVFSDVAANEMLKLLDDDFDIFEEMKKKVNLLELQMRKNEDLHLYHQGIVGQIEAAEIILSTLTPFEEDLEAVKEYVVKLDHQLDNSTADFVTKFVVRADNFLKKAQQSLEIIQYEDDNGEQISENNSLTIENKTKESGEYERTYSRGNSQTESILNYNINTENSMYEPISQSSMGESELKENDVDLSTSVNEEANSVVPSGTDSLAQDFINHLQNAEDHDATEGTNGVKDMNDDDTVDSAEIKSSINNPNEAIDEDLVRRLNPKFKHLFDKAQTHRDAHENIKNGGKETEDGSWMTGMSLFSLLTSGLLVVILVCWMVGKIVLRTNSYKRLDASHRNC